VPGRSSALNGMSTLKERFDVERQFLEAETPAIREIEEAIMVMTFGV
jgi:hypothetical protein